MRKRCEVRLKLRRHVRDCAIVLITKQRWLVVSLPFPPTTSVSFCPLSSSFSRIASSFDCLHHQCSNPAAPEASSSRRPPPSARQCSRSLLYSPPFLSKPWTRITTSICHMQSCPHQNFQDIAIRRPTPTPLIASSQFHYGSQLFGMSRFKTSPSICSPLWNEPLHVLLHAFLSS